MTTLTLCTHNKSFITAEFDEEFAIRRLFYNDKKVKVTPWREEIIWKRFNEVYDLQEAQHEQSYKGRWV